MSMAELQPPASDGLQMGAVPERCPFRAATVSVVYPKLVAIAGRSASSFSTLSADPHGLAQMESKRRIERDRSRQKRGPPVLAIL